MSHFTYLCHICHAMEDVYAAILFLAALWLAGAAAEVLKCPALVGELICGAALGPHDGSKRRNVGSGRTERRLRKSSLQFRTTDRRQDYQCFLDAVVVDDRVDPLEQRAARLGDRRQGTYHRIGGCYGIPIA